MNFIDSMCFWHVWLVRPALFTATKMHAGWVQRSATSASTCLLSLSLFLSSFHLFSSFSASTLRASTWSWKTFLYKLQLCKNSLQSSESSQLFKSLDTRSFQCYFCPPAARLPSTGATIHRGHHPQGPPSTGATIHRGHHPQGPPSTGATIHRGAHQQLFC